MSAATSGSRNPAAAPSATTFLSQKLRRRPALNSTRRGSARNSRARRGAQLRERGVVVLVRARIDLADARGSLQRRAPLPAGGTRRDAHVRRPRFLERDRRASDAVARQPVLPALVFHAEHLADELAARSRVVDVQVGAQLAAVFELQLVEEAVLAARRANNLALETDDAGALGERAQVARRETGVEVQRVAQVLRDAQGVGREDEAVGERHREFVAEILELRLQAERLRLVPEVIERTSLDERAERPERPPERLPRRRPFREFRAQAVGRLRLVDEVVLVDAEVAQHLEHRRQRGLRETHGRGFGTVDHVDRALPASLRVSEAAASQPAVPPPTMAIRLILRSGSMSS